MARFLRLSHQTSLIKAIIGFLSVFGFVVGISLYLEVKAQPQTGPILFWQDDRLFTINPNGTGLKRISPALDADRRQSVASDGCHGLVDASCWVLVGHVLYHVSGDSLPLPLPKGLAWLNSPASWSPDGVHLAYPVENTETGERTLLVYDTLGGLVWRIADGIDDSITASWSIGCRNALQKACYLAYVQKGQLGQHGMNVAILSFGNGTVQQWNVASGRGNKLRWSHEDRLYYGRFDWYYVDNGTQVAAAADQFARISLSPAADYAAYTESRDRDCTGCVDPLVWLGTVASDQLTLIHVSPTKLSEPGFDHDPFWSPRGHIFAAFKNGTLAVHELVEDTTAIWYQSSSIQILGSYAFAPSDDVLAFVEGTFIDNPEKPLYRLLIVDKSGHATTLRTRSSSPIVVLAWMPATPDDSFIPRRIGEFAQNLYLFEILSKS